VYVDWVLVPPGDTWRAELTRDCRICPYQLFWPGLAPPDPRRRYPVGSVDRWLCGIQNPPQYRPYRHVGVRHNGRGKRSAAPGSVFDYLLTKEYFRSSCILLTKKIPRGQGRLMTMHYPELIITVS